MICGNFRVNVMSEKNNKEKPCPFCTPPFEIVARNSMAIAFGDKYPIVKDHTLIISLKHAPSFFDLDTTEKIACFGLIDEVRQIILKKDLTVSGFNIGINDGIDAGQTIFHCHIHVIPRRKADVTNPRGGIRNIIPSTNY